MSLPNPLGSRMEWVAKNYGDYVTMATFGAWAEATGQHGFREHIARMFQDITMEGKRHWVVANLARFGKDWRAPMDSRFDRYLPWAAREFNRMFKPYKKIAKREGLPEFPTEYDLAARRVPWDERDDPDLEHQFDAYQRGLTALAQDTRVLQDRFRAVVDWADSEKVDLNKYTWREAVDEAHDWVAPVGALAQGEVVFAFDDGWTVQELTTQEQLTDEDEAMQHCVGEYFDEVAVGQTRIFSLRDPGGLPHATLEWNVKRGFVPQLKGKQNAAPLRPYLLRMIPFRRAFLDPISKVRPQSGLEAGVYGELRKTPYLGAWAFNPEGLLQDKIGGFGALEAAMENDVLYLVYGREWAGVWDAYELDELAEADLTRLRADFASTAEEVPGLDWAVWSCNGMFPRSIEDEMVEQLHSEGVQPPAAVAAIKDRLLRC